MPRRPLTVGDVVRNETRFGPRPTSVTRQCPGCTRFVGPTTSHCIHCGVTFVPLARGHVQVIGVD